MTIAKNIPEAEVALRLAIYLSKHCPGFAHASVAIDGAAAPYFEIIDYLCHNGWPLIKQHKGNTWRGVYGQGDKTLDLHSKSGVGDVMVEVEKVRLIAECKKGPREASGNGYERKLLSEVIGQAAKWNARPGDVVLAAVPRTPVFEQVAGDWLASSLFRRTGIQIVLVGSDDSAILMQSNGPAEEFRTLLPAILHRAFKGELE